MDMTDRHGADRGDTLPMLEIDAEMTIDEFYAGFDYSAPAEAEPRA
jgi:hypothetical protein